VPLAELALPPEPHPTQFSVKAAVLPFARLPGSDPVLGPEMHATGEVMATAPDVATALAKAERAAGRPLPAAGFALLCVNGDGNAVHLAHQLDEAGVRVYVWPQAGAPADLVEQLPAATIVSANGFDSFSELVRWRTCSLVVAGADDHGRMRELRQAAVSARVPLVMSPAGVAALARALSGTRTAEPIALQDYLADMGAVDRRALEPLARGATE
jgi:carbamoyl-phosphate synthase large subunit